MRRQLASPERKPQIFKADDDRIATYYRTLLADADYTLPSLIRHSGGFTSIIDTLRR